ncbi:MAG: IS982 family transposase [Bacteroidaceae bacterium]|nr:IS982 family transposase [Bacteroidaceae bacterium]
MYKKLRISMILNNLKANNLLNWNYHMHDLYAIFVKILEICKDFFNEKGNISRVGLVRKFSVIEVMALSFTAEILSIDRENFLLYKLEYFWSKISNLISCRQFNDSNKYVSTSAVSIRKQVAMRIGGKENYFCIDFKPVEVCRWVGSKRCKMGTDSKTLLDFGYCASQGKYYYGYKLHTLWGLSGTVYPYYLTKASAHNIHYLQDVKYEYQDCSIFGDRVYISKEEQLDLFKTASIRLEVSYRINKKDWKPQFISFVKARKRIETGFSQLADQFMMIRNYVKQTDGLFARVIRKITGFTFLQYINFIHNRSIGRIKFALI